MPIKYKRSSQMGLAPAPGKKSSSRWLHAAPALDTKIL